jgi:putative ABC transport system permease protein
MTTKQLLAAPVTAGWAIRTYLPTYALIALLGAIALAVTLPENRFASWNGRTLGPALQVVTTRPAPISALPPDGFTLVPGQVQGAELNRLFPVLLLVAGLAAVVGQLAIGSQSIGLAHQRAPEVGVRRAAGARRWQLVAAGLLESGAIGAVALGVGLTFGAVVSRLAVAQWPGTLGEGTRIPGVLAAGLIAATIGLGVLLPLHHARLRQIREVLPTPEPLLGATLQLGLCLGVLTGGALLEQHGQRLLGPGHSTVRTGAVFSISGMAGPDSGTAGRYGGLLDKLRETPGVQTASLTSPGAMVGLGTVEMVTTDCGLCYVGQIYLRYRPVRVVTHLVSPDSFAAIGMRVVQGRAFDRRDRWGAPRTVVINQALAAHYFQDGQPLGRDLFLGLGPDKEAQTVIGVVADEPRTGFGTASLPLYSIYLSVTQHPAGDTDLLVRTDGGEAPSAGLSGIIASILGLSPASVRRVSEASIVSAEIAPLAWFGRWFGVEGWVMLVLAFAGTFAAMRRWVISLYPELGLRKALGATRRDLILLVGRGVLQVALRGTLAGLAVGYVLWGALAGMIAGLPAWDPLLVGRYALLLALTAAAGAAVAGWQGLRAQPVELLQA